MTEHELETMLRHRGLSITGRVGNKIHTSDGNVILDFKSPVKKSDVAEIIESYPSGTILIASSISKPALSLLQHHELTFIHKNIIQIDRTRSNDVPTYSVMEEKEVVSMESTLKCSRDKWPQISKDDPYIVYLGIKKGTCLHVTDKFKRRNIRHVT